MKNITKYIIGISILVFGFVACSQKENNEAMQIDKPKIAVSIYPLKAILAELVGDKMEIEVIVPPNASPHTFEPTPIDIQKIEKADAIFYVNRHLDSWLIKSYNDKSVSVLKMIDRNLIVNTSHHCSSCGDEHHNEIETTNEDESIDPHFWTSPILVKNILPKLVGALIKIDAENAEFYHSKEKEFSEALVNLDEKIKAQLQPLKNYKVFTLHNSFSYFINNFGLTYGGAIEEKAGQEPSTRYFYDIAKQIKEAKVAAIFSEAQLKSNIMENLANELGVKVFELDPIGGKDSLTTYFDIITYNANVIEKAFGIK